MSFDVAASRSQFPILQRQVNGKPLIYLDSAASAQKPRAVIDAMVAAMEGAYANVHRGLHTLANEATEAYESARESVRRLLNADSPSEIVFTKGATEAINLVASSFGQSLRPVRASDALLPAPAFNTAFSTGFVRLSAFSAASTASTFALVP